MKYIVYKTTNLINNKFYYGVHLERRKSDGYIGCGVCSYGTAVNLKRKKVKSLLIDAVIKYGYKNFKKEIIKEFENKEDAYNFEKNILTENLLNDEMCYNIKTGGTGGLVKNNCKSCSVYDIIDKKILHFNSIQELADYCQVKRPTVSEFLFNEKRILLVKRYKKIKDIKSLTIYKNNIKYEYLDIHSFCHDFKIKVYKINMLLSEERKSHKGFYI